MVGLLSGVFSLIIILGILIIHQRFLRPNWKNLPCWLKDGFSGIVIISPITLILFFVGFLWSFEPPTSGFLFILFNILSIILSILAFPMIFISEEMISPIVSVLLVIIWSGFIGVIVGLIIRKIKRKKI